MQIARHATESYEDGRCDFENSERDWRVLDATDKCVTVCHGMSKSLLLIHGDHENKNISLRKQRREDSKGIGIGVMQRGKYTLGLHEI